MYIHGVSPTVKIACAIEGKQRRGLCRSSWIIAWIYRKLGRAKYNRYRYFITTAVVFMTARDLSRIYCGITDW